MEALAVCVAVAAIVAGVLAHVRHRKQKKLLAAGLQHVKRALELRLERVYTNALDADDAALMTRGVLALLVGDPPQDPKLAEYCAANHALIEQEANRLLAQPQIQSWFACVSKARNPKTFVRLTRDFYEQSAGDTV